MFGVAIIIHRHSQAAREWLQRLAVNKATQTIGLPATEDTDTTNIGKASPVGSNGYARNHILIAAVDSTDVQEGQQHESKFVV